MDKNLKLEIRLINGTLAIGLTASAITPLAVVLGNNVKNLLQNNSNNIVDPKNITNNGYGLTSDGYATLGSTDPNSNIQVSAHTPNTFKAIPNGYVFPTNNNGNASWTNASGNRLVCVNKNNLNEILWYADLEGRTVLQIEYLPSLDSIVFLYIEANINNPQNQYDLKVGIIDQASTTQGNIGSFSPETINSETRIDNSLYRADMWGMTPIFNTNGPTEELLIYRKTINGNDDNSKLYIYNAKLMYVYSNGFSNPFRLDNSNNLVSSDQAILSFAAIEYEENNQKYLVLNPIIAKKENSRLLSIHKPH